MFNNQSIKTTLTQNLKAKHISNAHTKIRRERKVTKSFGALFLPYLGRTFPLIKPLNCGEGEELKPFKFERNMRALRRSPRGARED